jgi:hypothetical protein
MVANSQVFGVASMPGSDYIFVSVASEDVAGVIERFDPATGSFFVAPTPPFEITSVRGVAGGILWADQGGGMMSHFAAFSTTTLTPLSCARTEPCAPGGANGTSTANVEGGILAFEEAGAPKAGLRGYWLLDCIAGPRPSMVARLQLPSDAGTPMSTSIASLLALGDGYLVTFARVSTNAGSGVAIFPLDPRCAP